MPSRIHRTIVQTSVVIKRLPKPTTKNYMWQDSAACREHSPDLFFFSDSERGPEKEEKVRQAKAICSTCSVIDKCREFAITTRQDFGVWGGMTEDELYYARTKKRRKRDEE